MPDTMTTQYSIVHYRENGHDFFQEWLDNLKDFRGRKAVLNAIDRAEDGNLGVHRFCRDDVWELVIDTGPGYRVYYSMIGDVLMLLLCAGDKSRQQRDINKAVSYIKKYKEEHHDH